MIDDAFSDMRFNVMFGFRFVLLTIIASVCSFIGRLFFNKRRPVTQTVAFFHPAWYYDSDDAYCYYIVLMVVVVNVYYGVRWRRCNDHTRVLMYVVLDVVLCN